MKEEDNKNMTNYLGYNKKRIQDIRSKKMKKLKETRFDNKSHVKVK